MTRITPPVMALALMMAFGLPAASGQAQTLPSLAIPHPAHAEPRPILHLSASAQTVVPQDWLTMTLAVQKEGNQASAVQKQLNAVLSAALAVATPWAKSSSLDVSTGQMNVSPRYGREGKVSGWVGTARLVLQGRDAEQIATLAGRLQDLNVENIDWRLSPEQKSAVETRIQAEAVAQFKSKAQALTQEFGFATYILNEVRVSVQQGGENGGNPRMVMATQMDSASPPVPTLAGNSRVVVNISGSIVLR